MTVGKKTTDQLFQQFITIFIPIGKLKLKGDEGIWNPKRFEFIQVMKGHNIFLSVTIWKFPGQNTSRKTLTWLKVKWELINLRLLVALSNCPHSAIQNYIIWSLIPHGCSVEKLSVGQKTTESKCWVAQMSRGWLRAFGGQVGNFAYFPVLIFTKQLL